MVTRYRLLISSMFSKHVRALAAVKALLAAAVAVTNRLS
jgi:hypothetical protein